MEASEMESEEIWGITDDEPHNHWTANTHTDNECNDVEEAKPCSSSLGNTAITSSKSDTEDGGEQKMKDSYSCDRCDHITNDFMNFITHKNMHIKDDKRASSVFICGMCDYDTPSAESMAEHIQTHLKPKTETNESSINNSAEQSVSRLEGECASRNDNEARKTTSTIHPESNFSNQYPQLSSQIVQKLQQPAEKESGLPSELSIPSSKLANQKPSKKQQHEDHTSSKLAQNEVPKAICKIQLTDIACHSETCLVTAPKPVQQPSMVPAKTLNEYKCVESNNYADVSFTKTSAKETEKKVQSKISSKNEINQICLTVPTQESSVNVPANISLDKNKVDVEKSIRNIDSDGVEAGEKAKLQKQELFSAPEQPPETDTRTSCIEIPTEMKENYNTYTGAASLNISSGDAMEMDTDISEDETGKEVDPNNVKTSEIPCDVKDVKPANSLCNSNSSRDDIDKDGQQAVKSLFNRTYSARKKSMFESLNSTSSTSETPTQQDSPSKSTEQPLQWMTVSVAQYTGPAVCIPNPSNSTPAPVSSQKHAATAFASSVYDFEDEPVDPPVMSRKRTDEIPKTSKRKRVASVVGSQASNYDSELTYIHENPVLVAFQSDANKIICEIREENILKESVHKSLSRCCLKSSEDQTENDNAKSKNSLKPKVAKNKIKTDSNSPSKRPSRLRRRSSTTTKKSGVDEIQNLLIKSPKKPKLLSKTAMVEKVKEIYARRTRNSLKDPVDSVSSAPTAQGISELITLESNDSSAETKSQSCQVMKQVSTNINTYKRKRNTSMDFGESNGVATVDIGGKSTKENVSLGHIDCDSENNTVGRDKYLDAEKVSLSKVRVETFNEEKHLPSPILRNNHCSKSEDEEALKVEEHCGSSDKNSEFFSELNKEKFKPNSMEKELQSNTEETEKYSSTVAEGIVILRHQSVENGTEVIPEHRPHCSNDVEGSCNAILHSETSRQLLKKIVANEVQKNHNQQRFLPPDSILFLDEKSIDVETAACIKTSENTKTANTIYDKPQIFHAPITDSITTLESAQNLLICSTKATSSITAISENRVVSEITHSTPPSMDKMGAIENEKETFINTAMEPSKRSTNSQLSPDDHIKTRQSQPYEPTEKQSAALLPSEAKKSQQEPGLNPALQKIITNHQVSDQTEIPKYVAETERAVETIMDNEDFITAPTEMCSQPNSADLIESKQSFPVKSMFPASKFITICATDETERAVEAIMDNGALEDIPKAAGFFPDKQSMIKCQPSFEIIPTDSSCQFQDIQTACSVESIIHKLSLSDKPINVSSPEMVISGSYSLQSSLANYSDCTSCSDNYSIASPDKRSWCSNDDDTLSKRMEEVETPTHQTTDTTCNLDPNSQIGYEDGSNKMLKVGDKLGTSSNIDRNDRPVSSAQIYKKPKHDILLRYQKDLIRSKTLEKCKSFKDLVNDSTLELEYERKNKQSTQIPAKDRKTSSQKSKRQRFCRSPSMPSHHLSSSISCQVSLYPKPKIQRSKSHAINHVHEKPQKKSRESSFQTKKVYRCEFCDYSTSKSDDLFAHCSRRHTEEEKVYMCEKCNYITCRQSKLVAHKKTHEAPDEYEIEDEKLQAQYSSKTFYTSIVSRACKRLASLGSDSALEDVLEDSDLGKIKLAKKRRLASSSTVWQSIY